MAPKIHRSTKLCPPCKRIDFAELIATRYRLAGSPSALYKPVSHYTRFGDLKKAARTCSFCRLVVECSEGEDIPDNAQIDLSCHTQRHEKRWKGMKGEAIFGIDVGYLDMDMEKFGWIKLGAYVDEESPLAKSNLITGRPVRPGSDIRTLSNWIETCNKSHDKCMLPYDSLSHEYSPSPVLPARLIEVGDEDSPSVRLIWGWKVSGPYITLSYCWGKSPTLKTTKATLPYRLNGIKLTALPKTFQDAIYITRKLGIKYIWVDSLCIVQDDLKDWEEESAKMAEIYTSSYLTIAASSSEDGNGGLFYPRPEDNISLKYTAEDRVQKIHIRKRTPDIFDVMTTTPLNSRAWVLQESLLSPRTIHYTNTQLFWTCQEATLAEDGYLFDDVDTRTGEEHNRNPNLRIHNALQEGDPVKMHEKWLRIMKKYGKCQLSFKDDKLPALSGLASVWARATRDRYFAGHWEKFLHFGLGWTCDPQPSKNLSRAPSWSWASVDGDTAFFAGLSKKPFESTSAIEDVTADVQPMGINKYGRVKPGGTLTFTAPFFEGKTKLILSKADWPADESYEPWEGPATVLYDNNDSFLGKIDYDLQCAVPEIVTCVQIITGGLDWPTNIWLVIEPVLGEDTYQRTGRVFIRQHDMSAGKIPPKRRVTLV